MIRLSNISKSFTRPDRGQLDVLVGIECEIGSGEFVAVVGRQSQIFTHHHLLVARLLSKHSPKFAA